MCEQRSYAAPWEIRYQATTTSILRNDLLSAITRFLGLSSISALALLCFMNLMSASAAVDEVEGRLAESMMSSSSASSSDAGDGGGVLRLSTLLCPLEVRMICAWGSGDKWMNGSNDLAFGLTERQTTIFWWQLNSGERGTAKNMDIFVSTSFGPRSTTNLFRTLYTHSDNAPSATHTHHSCIAQARPVRQQLEGGQGVCTHSKE